MLFGCDPENGVEADTKFIQEFIAHIVSSFDAKTGSVAIPACLSQIEQRKVKFESVTDNLGRMLKMTRQDNKVGLKTLMVLIKADVPSDSLQFAVQQYKSLFGFTENEILYLNEAELVQIEQRIFNPFSPNLQANLSAELVAKLKKFATNRYFGSNTAFNN